MGIVNVPAAHGTFGIAGAKLVAPGHPEKSILHYRIAKTGLGRMPHIGSEIVDDRGVRLIHDWIRQLPIRKDERGLIDKLRAASWVAEGFTEALRTPDSTLVFVDPDKAVEIRTDQINCMGCLSACGFSNWAQNETGTTGKKADPRSYCIQKTLQSIVHTEQTENNLMFAGHNAYRFKDDPFYSNGFVPTVSQLVDRILTGD